MLLVFNILQNNKIESVEVRKVRTPAKLTLDAAGEVNIIDFEMELGAELEIFKKNSKKISVFNTPA